MSNRSFDIFTKVNDFTVNKNVGYGEKNGYLITLYQMRFTKTFIIPLPSITKEQKKQVIEYLRNEKKNFHINRVYFDNTVLIIKLKENMRTVNVEILNNLVEDITNYLKKHNISVGKYCIICGKDNADNKINLMNIEYYVHRNCYENALAEVDKELEKNNNVYETSNNKTFFANVSIFVAAMFVGLLWYLLSTYGWVSALIMLSAGKFSLGIYLLFKNKKESYTNMLITMAVLVVYIISSILILNKNGISFLGIYNSENEQSLNIIVGFITSIIGLLFTFLSKDIYKNK